VLKKVDTFRNTFYVMKPILVLLFALFLSVAIPNCAFSQISPKAQIQAIRKSMAKTHTDIDWNAYDMTSKIPIDNINIQELQGVWKAYNGIFKFNGTINSMALTTPMLLEFKDDNYRGDVNFPFNGFTLIKNHLQAREGDWNGYINSISDKLLVITLNSGENRTRYYYEK
jgi:hypothetical protein